MFVTNVNVLAIFIAAIVSMMLGFLWYSPLLFGKTWMKLVSKTDKDVKQAKKRMGLMYVISFFTTLLTAYILALFIGTIQVQTPLEGLELGVGIWAGFITPIQLTSVLFAGKPWKLYLIETGYQLASILAVSLILALWI